jgi:hypothetical protein
VYGRISKNFVVCMKTEVAEEVSFCDGGGWRPVLHCNSAMPRAFEVRKRWKKVKLTIYLIVFVARAIYDLVFVHSDERRELQKACVRLSEIICLITCRNGACGFAG